jgi:hypothetical protein
LHFKHNKSTRSGAHSIDLYETNFFSKNLTEKVIPFILFFAILLSVIARKEVRL